jgi:hypothetical protein
MPPLWRLPPACRSALLVKQHLGKVRGIGFAKAQLAEKGGSISPGLTALTRMFRSIRSVTDGRR